MMNWWVFHRTSVHFITQPLIKMKTNSNGYGYVFGVGDLNGITPKSVKCQPGFNIQMLIKKRDAHLDIQNWHVHYFQRDAHLARIFHASMTSR